MSHSHHIIERCTPWTMVHTIIKVKRRRKTLRDVCVLLAIWVTFIKLPRSSNACLFSCLYVLTITGSPCSLFLTSTSAITMVKKQSVSKNSEVFEHNCIGAQRSLKVVVHLLNMFRAGQKKWSTYIYIISGRGRKSGGAIALVRWAPLYIYIPQFRKWWLWAALAGRCLAS